MKKLITLILALALFLPAAAAVSDDFDVTGEMFERNFIEYE